MLGVFLNNDLSFNTLIFSFGKKSRQVCNLLLYAYSGLNNNSLISWYKVYVSSLLDFTSIIYSPYYMYLIDLQENVQRNFTKICLVYVILIML